jgi:SAM-dependent methyltransferase
VYDAVADEYDRHRPTYPDALIDRAWTNAGLGRGDPVLDIGCGTGQLTRSLVSRGLRVTALDPGARLIARAQRNLDGRGEVAFVRARFEDAPLPSEHFGAVFCASAFHWLDPAVSWLRAAETLASDGTLVLMQYCGLNDPRSRSDQEAILAVLARIVPEIGAGWPAYRDLAGTVAGAQRRRANVSEAWAWLGSHAVARPEAAGLFGDVQVAAEPVLMEQTADEVNALLRTISAYQRISPGRREALESEIAALYARLGRPIRSSTVAVLVTARRAS